MILLSSGSIPVHRNPDKDSRTNSRHGVPKSAPSASVHASLFRETSAALAAGEAIGVFPEGTSYTEPSIAQMKDGAAWAAVEYLMWENDKDKRMVNEDNQERLTGKGLVIIPVGIVYTDKSQYLSRVSELLCFTSLNRCHCWKLFMFLYSGPC